MNNSAVATSGPYFGGSIVSDKEIIPNAPSVSVFCENCIDADALTKIYSIKPEQDISGIDHARLNIDENGLTCWVCCEPNRLSNTKTIPVSTVYISHALLTLALPFIT